MPATVHTLPGSKVFFRPTPTWPCPRLPAHACPCPPFFCRERGPNSTPPPTHTLRLEEEQRRKQEEDEDDAARDRAKRKRDKAARKPKLSFLTDDVDEEEGMDGDAKVGAGGGGTYERKGP